MSDTHSLFQKPTAPATLLDPARPANLNFHSERLIHRLPRQPCAQTGFSHRYRDTATFFPSTHSIVSRSTRHGISLPTSHSPHGVSHRQGAPAHHRPRPSPRTPCDWPPAAFVPPRQQPTPALRIYTGSQSSSRTPTFFHRRHYAHRRRRPAYASNGTGLVFHGWH